MKNKLEIIEITDKIKESIAQNWLAFLFLTLFIILLIISLGLKQAAITTVSLIISFFLFLVPSYLTAVIITEEIIPRIIYTFAFAPLYLTISFFILDTFFSITKTNIIISYCIIIIITLLLIAKHNLIHFPRKKIIPNNKDNSQENKTQTTNRIQNTIQSIKKSDNKSLKILFFISLFLILWIVILFPYFTQDNIHFIVSADIAKYIEQTAHYPFIKSIHNTAFVIYYPPTVPYTMAFFQLFHFGNLLVHYAVLPLLYFFAFLCLLYQFIKENKINIKVFYCTYFLLISSAIIAKTFISQISNDLYTLFYALLLLYFLSKKDIFTAMFTGKEIKEKTIFLTILFIGFSFVIRFYLGIIGAGLLLFIMLLRWNDCKLLIKEKPFQLLSIIIIALCLALFWYAHVYYMTGNPFYPIPNKLVATATNTIYDNNPQTDNAIKELAQKSLQLTWQGTFFDKINTIFFSQISFNSFSNAIKTIIISLTNIAANPFSLLIILLLILHLFQDQKNDTILFILTLLSFVLTGILWLFVDSSLQSPKFFFIIIPAIFITAALSLHQFLKSRNKEKIYTLFTILLFFVFLLNVIYLGFGAINQNINLIKNPFPHQENAQFLELKDIQTIAQKIELTNNEQILFLSRAETTAPIVYFIDNKGSSKYIWQYIWYDSEKAIALHTATKKDQISSFLTKNNVKYIVLAKERYPQEKTIYQDKNNPELIYAMLDANEIKWEKIAETTDLGFTKKDKNIVIYKLQ